MMLSVAGLPAEGGNSMNMARALMADAVRALDDRVITESLCGTARELDRFGSNAYEYLLDAAMDKEPPHFPGQLDGWSLPDAAWLAICRNWPHLNHYPLGEIAERAVKKTIVALLASQNRSLDQDECETRNNLLQALKERGRAGMLQLYLGYYFFEICIDNLRRPGGDPDRDLSWGYNFSKKRRMRSLDSEWRSRKRLAAQCNELASSFSSFLKKSIEAEGSADAKLSIRRGFDRVFGISLRKGRKEQDLDKRFVNVIVGKRSVDSLGESYAVARGNGRVRLLLHADDANISFSFDALERQVGHPLRSRVKDLLDIGVAVYMSDRCTRRWRNLRRRMGLLMPVRHPEVWKAAQRELERAVSFLGRDDFQVHFEEREEEANSDSLGDSYSIEHSKRCVCLFSGGVDSVAGAVWAVERGLSPILVSHYANNQLGCNQRALASQLKEKLDRTLVCVELTQGSLERLKSQGVPDDLLTMLQSSEYHVTADEVPSLLAGMLEDESVDRYQEILKHSEVLEHVGIYATKARGKILKTPRSPMAQHLRSFLFLSGIGTIYVFENGPVALNPLFSEARVNTHTAHPHFLAYFQALIRAVFGVDLTIENPFVYQTKGEVAKNLAGPKVGGLVAKTCSCWSRFRVPLMRKQGMRRTATKEAKAAAKEAAKSVTVADGRTAAEVMVGVGGIAARDSAINEAARAAAQAAVTAVGKPAARAGAEAAARAAATAVVRAAVESRIRPTVPIAGRAAADAAADAAAAAVVQPAAQAADLAADEAADAADTAAAAVAAAADAAADAAARAATIARAAARTAAEEAARATAAREEAARVVDGPQVTKAVEVMARAAATAAAQAAAKAAAKAPGECRHDGECLPCVLRRTSMHHAGLWDKDAPYLTDVFGEYPVLACRTIVAIADLLRFCRAVTSLPDAELLLRIPDLSVYEQGVDPRKLVEMYRKHAQEVLDCFRDRSNTEFQRDFARMLQDCRIFDPESFHL
jgi:hypothetical protein